MKYWLGINLKNDLREVFAWPTTPCHASHGGKYDAVRGPFNSYLSAVLARDNFPKGRGAKANPARKPKARKRRKGGNPWAICHAAVGLPKTAKFERCVRKVKARMKRKGTRLKLKSARPRRRKR